MTKKVLLAGESWMSHTTHVKGFDTFYTAVYETGKDFLITALETGGYDLDYIPNHLAAEQFPFSMEELKRYDCIILSDIGANTLLLPAATFTRSMKMPNRCNLLRDYVLDGGALLMIGGYLTFSGVDAKGKWHDTAVQEVLPVEVLTCDDRMEHCEGIAPKVEFAHEAICGLPQSWPEILGYNRTIAKEGAVVPVTVGGDPLLAVSDYGKGRTAAFTTDCAPHWAPPEFVNWQYYDQLWQGLVGYLTRQG